MDNPNEGQLAAKRLQNYRRGLVDQSNSRRLSNGNPAVNGRGSSGAHVDGKAIGKGARREDVNNEPVQDPLIYPGLYAPSGFDMMGILIRVRTRPNPVIDIGNVDSSVSLVLCDTALPDIPIVYCSETFETLTGYHSSEILGRNCRFLQHSPLAIKDGTAEKTNNAGRKVLREGIDKGEEARALLINYRKNGERFENLLTMIPIAWEEGEVGRRYIVGFQADARACFE